LVMCSYILAGFLGYFGFMGTSFKAVQETNFDQTGDILSQNTLFMFRATNPLAFFLRLLVFLLIFTSYPFVHMLVRRLILILFKKKDEPSNSLWILLNFVIIVFPTVVSIVYPKVGSILGYIGAFAGFFAIYSIPTVLHLKIERLKILNPILYKALEAKKVQIVKADKNDDSNEEEMLISIDEDVI